jgi:hypothetical protein
MLFFLLYPLGYVVLDSPYYSFLLINIILSHTNDILSNIILPLLLAAWGLLPNKNSYHIAGPELRAPGTSPPSALGDMRTPNGSLGVFKTSVRSPAEFPAALAA